MKAATLITGFTPTTLNDYMFRNLLIENSLLEKERDNLLERIKFYEDIFQVLKENADIDKSSYMNEHYISFGWIRQNEKGFKELMQVLDLEIPEPEKTEGEEEKEEE